MIQEIIRNRGIKEVLHFTTHDGLMGALYSGAVKSRKRLPKSVNLKYIYKPNAIYRKDVAWLDYVNLSISRINTEFFSKCCRWHRAKDLWWCILAFDPVILTHDGVYFATTNNIYTGVRRGTGPEALEHLFAVQTVQWEGQVVYRSAQLDPCLTTCVQAEVLYPEELSVNYLRHVYVEQAEDQDEVYAQTYALGISDIDVKIVPEKFGR